MLRHKIGSKAGPIGSLPSSREGGIANVVELTTRTPSHRLGGDRMSKQIMDSI